VKKLIIVATIAALLVGMAGCVGGDGSNGGNAYTLIVDFTAGGTVAVDDLPIPGKAILTYAPGTVVSLNASPSTGYRFVEWTGNATAIDDVSAASTSIAVDDNYQVVANFEPQDSLCDYECQQATPMGWLGYQFEHSKFSKYEVIFNWTDTPTVNDVGIYPALLHFWFEAGQGGYVGPQIEVYNSGTTIVKKVIFSIWSMNNQQFTAHPYAPACGYGSWEGNFVRCMITDYDWIEGKQYRVTIQKDEELADGVVWKATIEDLESEAKTLIGKIKLDDQGEYKGYGLLTGYTGGFFEYYFGSGNNCLEAEYGKIIRIGPVADDMWLPRKATYEHNECIRAVRYSPELGVIVEEVGEGVERAPEDQLKGSLWEFEHDIPLSELPQLQELFE
jgi:hypothetical protein